MVPFLSFIAFLNIFFNLPVGGPILYPPSHSTLITINALQTKTELSADTDTEV